MSRNHFHYFIIGLLLASCNQGSKFNIEGTVADGAGKTIYLEKAGISQEAIIDSAKIAKDGEFQFSQPAVSYPEFFRLRLNNQTITLGVDSSETIVVKADTARFATHYQIEGSAESEKIKDVTLKGLTLKQQLISLNDGYVSKKISAQLFTDSAKQVISAYKKDVLTYVYENPRSAVAYYTLFQRINGLMIFDPFDKADLRAYGAVATSWDTFFKESERTKQLTDITLQALKSQRQEHQVAKNLGEIKEQNQIEIVLPNIHGQNIKLSDMKGKVVLLDFTAYESDYSGPYNMSLAKVYEKFKDKGFTIYQVSLDPNENFWKVTASNLPWITVRDKNSLYSNYARSYNVSSLPTSYLLDREGAVVARGSNVKDIESEISKLL